MTVSRGVFITGGSGEIGTAVGGPSLDVVDPADADQLVTTIGPAEALLGGLDVVVNAAGVLHIASFLTANSLWRSQKAVGELSVPGDVTGVVAFLVSAAAARSTGQAVNAAKEW